ncbi:MAG: hypothetical protein AB1458_12930 [Bacteroidota bacterium]
MNTREKQLYRTIDRLLWDKWSSIGDDDIAESEEHADCVQQIYRLALNGAGTEEIMGHLRRHALADLGLFSNLRHCRSIAEEIVAVRDAMSEAVAN